MFLAKVWKTSNGKKYEAWVLKKGVWDKQDKRYRQVYLAYVGTSTKITGEKANEICSKVGISLGELRSVRRLQILDSEQQITSGDRAIQFQLAAEPQPPPETTQPAGPETDNQPFASGEIALPQERASSQPSSQPAHALLRREATGLIRKLREQFGLSRSASGYEELAMRIGILRVNASELRRAEAKETGLRPEQIGWLEDLLYAAKKRSS